MNVGIILVVQYRILELIKQCHRSTVESPLDFRFYFIIYILRFYLFPYSTILFYMASRWSSGGKCQENFIIQVLFPNRYWRYFFNVIACILRMILHNIFIFSLVFLRELSLRFKCNLLSSEYLLREFYCDAS